VYSATFIFAKGDRDDEFHRLDAEIASAAKATPGFLGAESWENSQTGLVSKDPFRRECCRAHRRFLKDRRRIVLPVVRHRAGVGLDVNGHPRSASR
jgi:hypothetical protein